VRCTVISVVGEMYSDQCCSRNVQLSVLYERFTVISVVGEMYSYQCCRRDVQFSVL
jgi:hypothetical protein